MDQSKIILWSNRFQEQKSSGLTIREWCEQQQITMPNYYYWKKRIHQIEPPMTEYSPVFAEFSTLDLFNQQEQLQELTI